MTAYEWLFRLDGRRAVVIGAGTGSGREAALARAAHGGSVVCAARALSSAEETASRCGGAAHPLDVLDGEAVRAAAAELEPDVLVITPATNVRKRLLDYTAEEFQKVVDLNLKATFDVVRAFGAGMVARGRGSIIGFASTRASVTEPGQGVYSATKAGVVQLLRTAAAEWGPHGVRANVIAPGVVETPLTQQIKNDPGWYRAYADKSALGRWARADEMAGAVVYLASDASS